MKKTLLSLFVLLPISVFAQTLDDDRAALVKFFNATAGPVWINQTKWKSDYSPCEWYGVGCENGRVISLTLSNNNLSHQIPTEIKELTALKRLDLSYNNLNATIPAELGTLPNLEIINFRKNSLSGSIPYQLAALKKLTVLAIPENSFTGSIPDSLFDLPELIMLDLAENLLSDSLSENIANAKKMQILNLGHNLLQGQLPSGIGELSELIALSLGMNKFSGELPSSLTKLTQLSVVALDHNNFTGVIPDFLSKQPNLHALMISDNSFSGGIPQLNQIPTEGIFAIENNFLNFDAIQPNLSNLDSYQYQKLHPVKINGRRLSIDAGGTTAWNTYRWIKNGAEYKVNKGVNYVDLTEDNVYWVQVTNDSVPGFVLHSQSYAFNSGSLPVTMVSFKAAKSSKGNLIVWRTASETNNAGFELEKSFDAITFRKIATLDGNGNSKAQNSYQFLDAESTAGSYYRLKQIDYDGTFTHSSIIYVAGEAAFLKVYPNPAKETIIVENSDASQSLQIFDLTGRKLIEKVGAPSHNIPTDALTPGTYIIKVGTEHTRLIIGQ